MSAKCAGKSLWWFSSSSQNGDLSWFASFNGLKIQVTLDFFLICKTRGGRYNCSCTAKYPVKKVPALGNKIFHNLPCSSSKSQSSLTILNSLKHLNCKSLQGSSWACLTHPEEVLVPIIASPVQGGISLNDQRRGSPGCPPANVGDVVSIPGLGRFHKHWGNLPCAPQPQSPGATTTEPTRVRAPQQEKSLQWEASAPQRRVAPTRHN